jgi:hypothetical protein
MPVGLARCRARLASLLHYAYILTHFGLSPLGMPAIEGANTFLPLLSFVTPLPFYFLLFSLL